MDKDSYSDELRCAIDVLRKARFDARGGLPEDLFLLVSSLTPLPNVDLLIADEAGRLLLSRRNDQIFGKGWHIPGGCIRFGESMVQRVQATARAELGCEVLCDPEPTAVCDVFREPNQEREYPNERCHHLAILFRCKLPDGYVIDNHDLTEDDPGYLKWFSAIPDDMLNVHDVYSDYLKAWIRRKGNDGMGE